MSRLYNHIVTSFNQYNKIHFAVYINQESLLYIVKLNNSLFVYNDADAFIPNSLQPFSENSIDEQSVNAIEFNIENPNQYYNWLFNKIQETSTFSFEPNNGTICLEQHELFL